MTAERLTEPRVARERNPSVPHEAHIIARATRVRDDDGVDAEHVTRVAPASQGRHGRPGFDGVYWRGSQVSSVKDAPVGRDGEKAPLEASVPQPILKGTQVCAHDGLERGVDAGRGRPPILPQRGIELMRERHRDAGKSRPQDVTHPQLMDGVDD
jgi:hypothetical protein